MKVDAWIGGILAEGDVSPKIREELLQVMRDKGLKVYERPLREPDLSKPTIKNDGSLYFQWDYWFNEGIATCSRPDKDGVLKESTIHHIFYNAKRHQVGFRDLTHKRSKKMTNYKTDKELATCFRDTVANNVILGIGKEPEIFGQVPKM